MATSYALVAWKGGPKDYTELSAKTDRGARHQAKKMMQSITKDPETIYYIEFRRQDDGCKGSIEL